MRLEQTVDGLPVVNEEALEDIFHATYDQNARPPLGILMKENKRLFNFVVQAYDACRLAISEEYGEGIIYGAAMVYETLRRQGKINNAKK